MIVGPSFVPCAGTEPQVSIQHAAQETRPQLWRSGRIGAVGFGCSTCRLRRLLTCPVFHSCLAMQGATPRAAHCSLLPYARCGCGGGSPWHVALARPKPRLRAAHPRLPGLHMAHRQPAAEGQPSARLITRHLPALSVSSPPSLQCVPRAMQHQQRCWPPGLCPSTNYLACWLPCYKHATVTITES